jgi:nucleotide-binding universal stress UspA family protein
MTDEPEQRAEPLPILGDIALRQLLVAIDGSPSSELALEIAVRGAKVDNAALTLLTVEPDVSTEAFRWSTSGSASAAVLQAEVREEAERTLREAVARIPEEIPVKTIHCFGKPGPEIVAQSEKAHYDAILVGARGVGPVRAMLGSVSQYVMRHASVHVIVARD